MCKYPGSLYAFTHSRTRTSAPGASLAPGPPPPPPEPLALNGATAVSVAEEAPPVACLAALPAALPRAHSPRASKPSNLSKSAAPPSACGTSFCILVHNRKKVGRGLPRGGGGRKKRERAVRGNDRVAGSGAADGAALRLEPGPYLRTLLATACALKVASEPKKACRRAPWCRGPATQTGSTSACTGSSCRLTGCSCCPG